MSLTSIERLDVGDHETVAAVRGNGQPVLLIHAIGLDHCMWDGVVDALDGSVTTVAYDLRGHHGAAPAPPVTSIAQLADDAATVLERIELGSVHVVGLSLGGAIAQELALRRPDLVSRLTLCATLCKGQEVARERAAAAERDGVESQITQTLDRWFTPATFATRPQAVAYAGRQLRTIDGAAWVASWRALAALDTCDRLGGLALPTHLVAGEHDRSTPAQLAWEIAARIPDATVAVLPNTAHMLSLEAPLDLAHEIRKMM
jgi:3-oxoadipate enol-lactonase